MRISQLMIAVLLILLVLSACSEKVPELTAEQAKAADTLSIDRELLRELLAKPLYRFTERDADIYLPYLQYTVPDLQERIKHLARKNLGQPYDIYLLGEYPAEIYDDQPLFTLKESDCVVFVEHTVSMALAHDWQSFLPFCNAYAIKTVLSGILRGTITANTTGPKTTPGWRRISAGSLRVNGSVLTPSRSIKGNFSKNAGSLIRCRKIL